MNYIMDQKFKDYFGENLKQVFLLIDFRHRPTNDDILMYDYLKYYKIPVTIVASKMDKVGKTLQERQKKIILDDLNLAETDDFIMFSSVTKAGKEEIFKKIEITS